MVAVAVMTEELAAAEALIAPIAEVVQETRTISQTILWGSFFTTPFALPFINQYINK
jgi:hypothetical protein